MGSDPICWETGPDPISEDARRRGRFHFRTTEKCMRLVYLLVCALALTAAADTPEETSGARNLALLEQYGELGRRGDYAAQARLWAPDAVNNGRPMSIDEIRAQLE